MPEQSKQPLKTRISHKHNLEVNWITATTFLPKAGELIIYDPEVDADGNTLTMIVNGKAVPALPKGRTEPYTASRIKVGDGYHYINDLEFTGGLSETDDIIFSCGSSEGL
jgi:hypothetical protein